MFSHLLLLVVGIAITGATTIIFTLDCKSPMDHGNGTEAVERFFYDPEPNCCFAFKYTGSGGNDNRYMTRSACTKTCAP
ncbi:serine protease inhibitor precursor, partial [Aphelenchoides avenae]